MTPDIQDDQKIHLEKFITWKTRYYAGNRAMRLGQTFINDYFPDLTFPELFYEEDDLKSEAIIYSYFIVVHA